MNIITKIFTILILISILSTVYCKKKETPLKHTIIPSKIFGIDFCKLQLSDIFNELTNKKAKFKCYDGSTGDEFKYTGERKELDRIGCIESNYFIGKGLDNKSLIYAAYGYIPFDEEFIFSIKFKEEYYDTLLELLNKQLGAENSNVNFRGYGEISWDDDPKHNSCILHIILSKRQQYDDPAKAEKGVCYLEIRTRARHPHVH